MIYFEEEYGETFNDEDHFKKWYLEIINYNYNTKLTTYNEAKRFHKSEGRNKLKCENNSNPYGFTSNEDELFQEVLRIGFI